MSVLEIGDDVIEVNPLPLPQIHHTVRSNRRIGLGIMGWADLLFLLGIPYHSSAARFLGEKLMQQITDWSVLESQKLAKIRGPFPNFNRSIYRDGEPLRNGTCTTVAPTGTISIIAGCSSGIEPVFALGFRHTVSNPDGSVRTIINSTFIDIAKEEGFYSLELEDWIVTNEALTGFNEWIEKEYAEVSEKRRPTVAVPSVPQWALEVFVNAHEVSTKDHVLTQASFQRGVHNGISKSVNMSHDSTVGDVTEAYMLAWNTGCKGITVFRDGCLATGQVLNVGKAVEPIASTKDQVVPSDLTIVPAELPPTVKELPKIMSGLTFNVNSPQGKVHVTINSDHEGPAEIFVNVGRAGSDVTGLAEGMGRLISYQLRTPSPLTPLSRLEDMRDQLDGIGGSNSVGFGAERVVSLPDAVAHALTSY